MVYIPRDDLLSKDKSTLVCIWWYLQMSLKAHLSILLEIFDLLSILRAHPRDQLNLTQNQADGTVFLQLELFRVFYICLTLFPAFAN